MLSSDVLGFDSISIAHLLFAVGMRSLICKVQQMESSKYFMIVFDCVNFCFRYFVDFSNFVRPNCYFALNCTTSSVNFNLKFMLPQINRGASSFCISDLSRIFFCIPWNLLLFEFRFSFSEICDILNLIHKSFKLDCRYRNLTLLQAFVNDIEQILNFPGLILKRWFYYGSTLSVYHRLMVS